MHVRIAPNLKLLKAYNLPETGRYKRCRFSLHEEFLFHRHLLVAGPQELVHEVLNSLSKRIPINEACCFVN